MKTVITRNYGGIKKYIEEINIDECNTGPKILLSDVQQCIMDMRKEKWWAEHRKFSKAWDPKE